MNNISGRKIKTEKYSIKMPKHDKSVKKTQLNREYLQIAIDQGYVELTNNKE